ncbi:hypothetical protein [Sporanaerobacter sp. PP17-6a]|nr:hypothetical protein [Sporanaerobacter sp. PP17-6a]SCL91862.1 hypothetical protein PP176A_2202 [Sporanaerobacter sp. PP17-6a]
MEIINAGMITPDYNAPCEGDFSCGTKCTVHVPGCIYCEKICIVHA